jgi:hypothetical protein
VFDPEDLVGRTFLMDEQEDGQRFRARIVKLIEDHETDIEENPTRIKFLCSLNEDQAEEIITYNKMLEYILRDDENPVVWKFRRITSHQGPLKPDHPDYNGSLYNVMVEWENGEITAEPLSIIAADDPVTCAIYAKEHGLLDKPGWKRFKSIAKRQKKFTRIVNQAKLRSYRTAPRYKYGFEIPRNFAHTVRLDERNGNTKWQDAVVLEREQIDEYQTFSDLGHKSVAKIPPGYKKIRVHLVFDVKHDGRHKGDWLLMVNLQTSQSNPFTLVWSAFVESGLSSSLLNSMELRHGPLTLAMPTLKPRHLRRSTLKPVQNLGSLKVTYF